MDRIEQQVRDSLQARAHDVEPTPHLWDEVDRRITRRQRVRLGAWVLAGAAAVVVAVVAVPGLLGSSVLVPEVDPAGPAPVPVPAGEDPGVDDAAPDTAMLLEPVVAVEGADLLLLTPDGVTTLVTLPEEGGSRFLSVAVRPGSTLDDLTIVTATSAEGFEDLRWTRIVDGEVEVAFAAFEGQYAPAAASSDAAQLSGPIWSPDGRSVAWLDIEAGGATLRTIGWDDGPGTGNPADDNAATSIGEPWLPDVDLQDWIALDDTRSRIRATHPDSMSGWFALDLERQADGALSFGTPQVVAMSDQAIGQVGAVAGDLGDGEPRWVARLTFDGALLQDRSSEEEVALPAALLPGDGFVHLWARPHGDGVLVGSRSTAVAAVVDVSGAVTEVGVQIGDAAPLG